MKLFISLIAFLASIGSSLAGHLEIAVIQYPEARDPSALAQALSQVDLAKLVDGDTTRTRDPILKNGRVIFTQGFPANRGSAFRSTTRMGAFRSDVEGRLGRSDIDFGVSVTEGVQAGLRSFQRRKYSGAGKLPTGPATIVSLQQGQGKSPYIVRGKSKVEKYSFTMAVIAQYRE